MHILLVNRYAGNAHELETTGSGSNGGRYTMLGCMFSGPLTEKCTRKCCPTIAGIRRWLTLSKCFESNPHQTEPYGVFGISSDPDSRTHLAFLEFHDFSFCHFSYRSNRKQDLSLRQTAGFFHDGSFPCGTTLQAHLMR